jgi:RNA polymerase sigma-70 factor (ECF subfamily)
LREYAVQEVAGLFDQLRDPLYRYFLCLGLSHDDAGDGVQETFLRLHQHLRRHGDSTNLRGWIFQVARNLVRNEIKRARRQRTEAMDEAFERQCACGNPVDSPEDQVLRQERLLRLQRAIVKLTPPQRECLRLRASGLRYREIAEVMGIGISSVGELMQRATGKLRERAE